MAEDGFANWVKPPPKVPKTRQPGKASIDKMMANAPALRLKRLETRKAIETAVFGEGDPETRIWIDRFEAYRKTDLEQDCGIPFDLDDLLGFLDNFIDVSTSDDNAEPTISKKTIRAAAAIIVRYGHFSWREFEFGEHAKISLRKFIQSEAKNGRLV